MALQTERLVARLEHLGIYRAVGIMTGHATFAKRLVLEDKRPALGFVTAEASLVRTCQVRTPTHDGVATMRIMAFAAAHFADGVNMGQSELTTFIKVALEAGLRIALGIDDGVRLTTRLRVQASRTMAAFAADRLVGSVGGDQFRMRGIVELTGDRLVALHAFAGAHELSARNGWRDNDRPVDYDARHKERSPKGDSAKQDDVPIQTHALDHGVGLEWFLTRVC